MAEGPADTQIFSGKPGTLTTAQIYAASGVRFKAADKSPGSRVRGATELLNLFKASRDWHATGKMEAPGLFFFKGLNFNIYSVQFSD